MNRFKSNWYNYNPELDKPIIFQAINTNENGYNCYLPEYPDINGFIIFSELSHKRIRKNVTTFLKPSRDYCGLVTSITDGVIYISLKDISDEEAKNYHIFYDHTSKLYDLTERLAHLDTNITSETWHNAFRDALDLVKKLDLHPYEILTDRALFTTTDMLNDELKQLVMTNYTKLFGFKPITLNKDLLLVTFRFDGNQELIKLLSSINQSDTLTNEQLYNDQLSYNLKILPMALPKFRISITAYNQSYVNDLWQKTLTQLQKSSLDIVKEC